MEEQLISMIEDIFGGWGKFITDEILKSSGTNLLDNLIAATQNFMIPVASVMLCIYFAMEIMSKTTSDNFNSDQFIKMIIQLIASIVIIRNVGTWTPKFVNIGTSLITLLQQNADTTINLTPIKEAIKNAGFLTKLSMIVTLSLPWAISFLARISIVLIVWGRQLEILIRAAFAPVACADIAIGGSHSNGFRYIKKLIALGLQGIMMIIIATAGQAMIAQGLFDGTSVKIIGIGFLGRYFGILASMVGMLSASKNLAFEAVGA